MRIALDAMGGDYAPGPVVLGAIQAVQKDPEMHVVLVGDAAQIEPHLAAAGDCRPEIIGGECLGDGDQLDRIRRPAAIARAPRDLLPQRGEAPNRVRGAVVNEVRQSRLQSVGDAGSRHCTA